MTVDADRIASEFFAAIERGDLDAVRELYSPEAEIWHNVTGRSQTREENLSLLQYFTGRVSGLRYEVLAREFFPGGFVQRHVLHGRLDSGDLIAAPVCLVVRVAGDRIERLFELPRPCQRPRCLRLGACCMLAFIQGSGRTRSARAGSESGASWRRQMPTGSTESFREEPGKALTLAPIRPKLRKGGKLPAWSHG